MNYDFPGAVYLYIAASAPPFANRVELSAVPFEDPYRNVPGGDTHPLSSNPPFDAQFPGFGAYGVMDPDINSPRLQQWNVTLERQLGASWGVSAAYLGSYADRLWAQTALNPGVFLGVGPCTLNTSTGPRTFPVCSTNANLNQRRKLSLQDPIKAAKIGALDLNSDVGWQKYRGLKLSARHRTATGVSLNTSYTLSKCEGTDTATAFNQISAGYTNPDDPDFDAGKRPAAADVPMLVRLQRLSRHHRGHAERRLGQPVRGTEDAAHPELLLERLDRARAHRLAAVVKPARVNPVHRDARVFRCEGGSVAREHEEFPGGEQRAVRERKADAAQHEARKVQRVRPSVL
jgi:hypothetical protein